MNNLRMPAWVKIARTLASSRGFGLRWASEQQIEQTGAQAWNDGRYAYVRQPESTWTDKQFRLWLYQLVHEIGHSRPKRRGCFDVLRDKQPEGLLRFLHNLLEDFVQELDMHNDEPVLRDTLKRGRAEFYEWTLAERDRQPEKLEQVREYPHGAAVFCWDAELRATWNPHVGGMGTLLRKPIESDARVVEWTERLRAGTYGEELLAIPDVVETYNIAERILREVFEVEPEDCQQPSEGDGAGDGQEGEQGEQKGQGSGSSQEDNDDGQGQQGDAPSQGTAGGNVPKDSSGNAGSQAGDEVSTEFARFDYEDLLAHDHAEDVRGGQKRSGGCAIDYDRYFAGKGGYRAFTPDFDRLVVYDCTRDQYPEQDMRSANDEVPPSQLTRKIAKYMQANSKNKRVHGQKHGKLSNKSLYKLRVPGMAQGQRERIFNQRVVNKSKDVAVSIGIDLSGSMEEDGKAAAAIAAVTHLHSVIHQALRIPLEITGFSTEDDVGAHAIIQSFDRPRRNDQVEDDLRRLLAFFGANRDGEWLVWARERLLQQKASRHIMIVLSDGQPVHMGSGDVASYTRDVAKQIDADPRIDLYAIGILSEAVRHFYTNYAVIRDVTELEDKLLTVLRDKIIINL